MNLPTPTRFLLALGLVPLCMGGCPRPEDDLEPNDTFATATRLVPGEPAEARVVQYNPDVFVVAAGPDQTLTFTLENLGEEDCAAFVATSPAGETLYADTNGFCGRLGFYPMTGPGGTLDLQPADAGYILTVEALEAGDYYLTLTELGRADNIFDYSWLYRVTAQTAPAE
jgi:hypothetical protein